MPWILRMLIPCSFVFGCIVWLRRTWYQWFSRKHLSVPVIVVGNITVGGTGKTPFVIALAKQLTAFGYQPGIVLRGYSGHSKQYPILVEAHNHVTQVGDESLVIFKETSCPVCVDPHRMRGARFLMQQTNCNVILSDDGLQHYALPRNIEIALIDERGLGNGWLLPAGPLREPRSRLRSVAYVVSQSELQFTPTSFVHLNTQHFYPLDFFRGKTVHAVCAVGYPQRFFETLSQLEIIPIKHAFPDHYIFKKKDLVFDDPSSIIMTHKDATKCANFDNPLLFYLTIEANISGTLQNYLKTCLSKISI